MEYDPAEVDRFIDIADAIEEQFPSVVVDGQEVDGAFNVVLEDDKILISSQDTASDLPTAKDVLYMLQQEGYRGGA